MKVTTKLPLAIMICFIAFSIKAQPFALPANTFGSNHWMPEKYLNFPTQPGGACSYTNMQRMVDNLTSSIVRIGGIGYDLNGTAILTASTTNDYIRAIQQVKYNNPTARFIIQIPYASSSYGFSLGDVATLVGNLTAYFSTDVFYYSIGNEWNGYSPTQKTVANIAITFKSYAKAVKEADPQALVLSPSMTDIYATDATVSKNYYQDLFDPTSGNYIGGQIPLPSSAYPRMYCDIIDIHVYPGNDGSGFWNLGSAMSTTQYDCWRDGIGTGCTVTGMSQYAQNKFKNELSTGTYGGPLNYNGMQALINNCSPSRITGTSYPLTIAVTEFNITHQNPYFDLTSTSPLQNTFAGIGARSFFAGQWLMELYCTFLTSCSDKAAFMIPWSIHEASGAGTKLDLSMTRGTANNTTDPTPVPTYHHYEMLADNFRNCTNILQATTSNSNIKAYGAYNTLTGANAKFVVVLINQTSNVYNSTTVQLNNSLPGGNYAKMNFPGGPNVGYSYNLGANSTAVFVFNYGGELIRKVEYKLSDGSTGFPIYTHYSPVSSNYIVMTELGPDQATCCGGIILSSAPTMPSGSTYAWYSSVDNFATVKATTATYNVPVGNYVYKRVVTYNSQTAWDYARANVGPGGIYSCCKLTGINEESNPDENSFYTMPNPTDDKTTIKYTLPENVKYAKIDLTDISGKLIKSLAVSNENTSVDLDCKSFSGGIYFYSLNVNGTIIKTKKLVIAK